MTTYFDGKAAGIVVLRWAGAHNSGEAVRECLEGEVSQ